MVDDPLAPLPRRYMVWHGVRQFHPDEAASTFSVTSFRRVAARDCRAICSMARRWCRRSEPLTGPTRSRAIFQIQATARPNKSLDDIEKEINLEIERIKKEPPTDAEMTRAKNSIEAQRIFGLQTVLGKASQLTSYAGYARQTGLFSGRSRTAMPSVTAADVQRVANTYLTGNNLVMTYNPGVEPTARVPAAPATRRRRSSPRKRTRPRSTLRRLSAKGRANSQAFASRHRKDKTPRTALRSDGRAARDCR